jgi:hypothetical protein
LGCGVFSLSKAVLSSGSDVAFDNAIFSPKTSG